MLTSIKARVAAFYSVILLLVLSVLGAFLYLSLHRIVYEAIDGGLLSRAKALATLVDTEQGQAPFKFSDDIIWEYDSPKAKSYFQIRRDDGSSIQKSISLGSLQLPWHSTSTSPQFQTTLLKGHAVRIVNLEMRPDPEPSGQMLGTAEPGFVIQCGEDINERLALLHNYRWVLILAIMTVMVVSAAGGFFIASKALAPIAQISNTIDGISESNLAERVAVDDIPWELKVLAKSFNRTFDRLEKSFERQKQFIADASHELKTPLAVVVAQSEITLRKPRDEEDYKQALNVILTTARMMAEMVQKLVSVACLDESTLELRMEQLNLSQVVEEAVRLLAPVAERMEIGLRLSESTQAPIRGDWQALLEVFVNIVDNALKYNKPHGWVEISFTEEDGWLGVIIEDSGIGIPAAEQEKVFDRFYRVDKSRSKKIGGSGLGLSIAQEIVQLHGGRMCLTSAEGKGTTVTLWFHDL